MFIAEHLTSSLHLSLALKTFSIHLSIRSTKKSDIIYSLILAIHESKKAFQPKSVASRYIIPALETVAGEATDKSSTSKTKPTYDGKLIRSPFNKVKTLLSSSTVFILSIQRVSTGPSRIIHL